MKKIIKQYFCDRCGKEINPKEGTLRYEYPDDAVLLVRQDFLITGDNLTEEAFPDLCEDCFASLQNWKHHNEQIAIEQKGDVSLDSFPVAYGIIGVNTELLRKHWKEIIRLMCSDPQIPAVFIKWEYDDVRHVGIEMNIAEATAWSDGFCEDVLFEARKHHDPNTGINYEVIEFWINELK